MKFLKITMRERFKDWLERRRMKKANENILAEYLDAKHKMLCLNHRIDYLNKCMKETYDEYKELKFRLEVVHEDMKIALNVGKLDDKEKGK